MCHAQACNGIGQCALRDQTEPTSYGWARGRKTAACHTSGVVLSSSTRRSDQIEPRMSKRRKRRVKEAATPPPELTGIARLLSEMPLATLDLHGYTGPQARLRVRDFLTTHSRISAGSVVHVITGKGTGSEGGGVLLELTREALAGEAADLVDEYAGMLGGGGWVVRVK